MRWLHRWAGLACGLFLAAVALTGSVLVFQQPLLRAQYPQLASGHAPSAAEAAHALPRVLAEWSEAGLTTIDFPHAGLPVWQLYFADGTRRYLEARSGALVLERSTENDALLWLRDLHVHLLAGKRGEQVLGVLGLVAVFLLGSGLWRWWPSRGRWRFAWRLHRHPAPARWLSWHRAAGAALLPVTLVLIVTGTAMVYGSATRGALIALSGGIDVAAPAAIPDAGTERDWPALLAAAQAALPNALPRRLSAPRPGSALLTIRARAAGEWHPIGRSLIWLDANTGAVVKVHDARRQSVGARISEAFYPVHGAFVGGAPWEVLVAGGGAGLALLFATGLLFWWSRR